MGHSALFWETAPAEWERFFRTNLQGVMNCCHVALPEMVALERGRIVTIVSDAGRVGDARLAAYGASKAGGRLVSSAASPGRPDASALRATVFLFPPSSRKQVRNSLRSSSPATG